jgi:hypothetical protein
MVALQAHAARTLLPTILLLDSICETDADGPKSADDELFTFLGFSPAHSSAGASASLLHIGYRLPVTLFALWSIRALHRALNDVATLAATPRVAPIATGVAAAGPAIVHRNVSVSQHCVYMADVRAGLQEVLALVAVPRGMLARGAGTSMPAGSHEAWAPAYRRVLEPRDRGTGGDGGHRELELDRELALVVDRAMLLLTRAVGVATTRAAAGATQLQLGAAIQPAQCRLRIAHRGDSEPELLRRLERLRRVLLPLGLDMRVRTDAAAWTEDDEASAAMVAGRTYRAADAKRLAVDFCAAPSTLRTTTIAAATSAAIVAPSSSADEGAATRRLFDAASHLLVDDDALESLLDWWGARRALVRPTAETRGGM